MAEYEDVATVKFGKQLTKKERKSFEDHVDCFSDSPYVSIEWHEERID